MDFHSCNDGVIEIRFIFIYHLKQLKMNKILETVRLSQKLHNSSLQEADYQAMKDSDL